MSEELKRKSLFVQGATLITFAVLMGGFIAFKAGAFDSPPKEPVVNRYTKPSPQAEVKMSVYANSVNTSNSIPDDNRVDQRVVNEHNRQAMMYSSKTIVAIEPKSWVGSFDDNPLLSRTWASSSKSIVIADPIPWWKWVKLYEPVNPEEYPHATFRQGKK